jgi:hypothetical protein
MVDAFFLLLDFSFMVKPTIDPVKSVFVRFQAGNSLRADMRIMDGACGQIESITRFQSKLLSQLRQPEHDTTLHNVDHFVI